MSLGDLTGDAGAFDGPRRLTGSGRDATLALLRGGGIITGQGGFMAPSTRIVLGTATPGGGFPLYGDTVAAVINEVDDSLHVDTRNTKGSTENVPLLESGDLDLALVQGEVAHEARTGVGRPPAALPVLSAMYSTAGMFVVRGDAPARTIEDLRNRPVAFGARGSGLVILARYVLDGLGLDPQRDFEVVLQAFHLASQLCLAESCIDMFPDLAGNSPSHKPADNKRNGIGKHDPLGRK